MFGLVLAAGRGARMKGFGGYASKVLIPVGGTSLIRRNLAILTPHVNRFVVVVGPGGAGAAVQREVGCSYGGKPVTYTVQEEPKGPIGALKTALSDLMLEPALTVMGDEYFIDPNPALLPAVCGAWWGDGAVGVVPDSKAEEVRENYLVVRDPRGFVESAVEKPTEVGTNVDKGTGMCYVTPFMASSLKNLDDRATLADWFGTAVGRGARLVPVPVARDEYNVNTPEGLEHLRRTIGDAEHLRP